MKDAPGLDVTSRDPAAVAAADDFAARLLRLDRGVENILDAAKRWPETPIIRLYAAAFWLYGQTNDARAEAAVHFHACETLAMNARERALHRALALWHANANLRAVEALEAITTEWPGDLFTVKLAEFLYYVLGQQYMGPRFRAHMRCLEPAHADDSDFLAMAASPASCAATMRTPRRVRNARSASSRETRGRNTPSPTFSSGGAGCGKVWRAWNHSSHCLQPAAGRSTATTPGILHCCTSSNSTCPRRCASFTPTSGASLRTSWSSNLMPSRCCGASR